MYICYCDRKNPKTNLYHFLLEAYINSDHFNTEIFDQHNLICCLHRMEAQRHSKCFSVEYGFFLIAR